MLLTPCLTGTVALYQRDEETVLALTVEAWDETGVAYIAGTTKLEAAHTLPGFVRLEQAVAEVPNPSRQIRQPVRGERPRGVPDGRPRERERP